MQTVISLLSRRPLLILLGFRVPRGMLLHLSLPVECQLGVAFAGSAEIGRQIHKLCHLYFVLGNFHPRFHLLTHETPAMWNALSICNIHRCIIVYLNTFSTKFTWTGAFTNSRTWGRHG
uniref:(northern house mosquito) hypothetical protein n=1 Tax=Culex pipiens TaxID=7175 RepID=A0A8D8C1H7_CULPI